METRAQWGPILLAGIVALALITGTYFFSTRDTAQVTPVEIRAESPTIEASGEWRAALDALARPAQTTGPYRAPAELDTTPSMSQELVAAYLSLKSTPGASTDQAVADIVSRNVTVLTRNDTYTLATVRTGAVTLEAYAQTIGDAMERASTVRVYELSTFSRTVAEGRTTGTPALAESAKTYRTIEASLASTVVPTELRVAHLELVQSIAFLAYTTELMAGWSGDPVDALSYVDGFIKAEREVKAAFNALFSAMIALGKTS